VSHLKKACCKLGLLEDDEEDGWVESDDVGPELGNTKILGDADEEDSVEGPDEGALLELGLFEGAEEGCFQDDVV